MRPLSEAVEEVGKEEEEETEEEEEEGRAAVVDGRNAALAGGGAYELWLRDCESELACFSSSCCLLLPSASLSLSRAWNVARAIAPSTNNDVLSCLSCWPQVASNSNVDADLAGSATEGVVSGGRRTCDGRLDDGRRSRGRGTAMRLVVLSLDGGGEGKWPLRVIASMSRFACSCSPAVVACVRRAERTAPSLLPERLLDLWCLPSALFRRLDRGDERLLRGGRKAPVGVVAIATTPTATWSKHSSDDR